MAAVQDDGAFEKLGMAEEAQRLAQNLAAAAAGFGTTPFPGKERAGAACHHAKVLCWCMYFDAGQLRAAKHCVIGAACLNDGDKSVEDAPTNQVTLLLLPPLQPGLQQPACSAQSALEARPCVPSWLSAWPPPS